MMMLAGRRRVGCRRGWLNSWWPSRELRERAVRLYRESDPKPVIRRLAEQLGCASRGAAELDPAGPVDRGERYDRPTTAETEELRRLRKENAELRRANEILKAASAFRPGDGPDKVQVVNVFAA